MFSRYTDWNSLASGTRDATAASRLLTAAQQVWNIVTSWTTQGAKDAALTEAVASSGAWVNVRAFGAKLDNTNDDTAALQAAHDALPTNGGTILIPEGILLMLSTVNITKNAVRIVGVSRYNRFGDTQASTLRFTGSSSNAFTLTPTPPAGQGFELSNVRIIVTQTTSGALSVVNVSGGLLRGCRIAGPGLATSTAIGVKIDNGNMWQFDDVFVSGFSVGIDLPQNNHLNTFQNVTSNDNQIGLRMGGTARSAMVSIFSSDFEGNTVAGIDIIRALSVHIHDIYTEDMFTSTVGIRIGPSAVSDFPDQVVISDSYLSGQNIADNGIQLNRVRSLRITGCEYGGYDNFIKNNGTDVTNVVLEDNHTYDGYDTNTYAPVCPVIDTPAGISGAIKVRNPGRKGVPKAWNGSAYVLSASGHGVQGEKWIDVSTGYVYYCIATNTWKRVLTATF